jgi:hypothetical protein
VLLLNECSLLEAYISLSTESGNFWIHPRRVEICGLNSCSSRKTTTSGCFEHGNDDQGSMRGVEFLEELNKYSGHSAPWGLQISFRSR